ncbi:MAG: hypothetical protein V8T10_06750 [Merdibacter sp.]
MQKWKQRQMLWAKHRTTIHIMKKLPKTVNIWNMNSALEASWKILPQMTAI